jgi:hypothetical protein
MRDNFVARRLLEGLRLRTVLDGQSAPKIIHFTCFVSC